MKSTYPDQVLHHCPRCGSGRFKATTATRFECEECSFVFFCNVACGVAGLIVNTRGELLVTVRAHEPKKGLFDLPGGFVDPGESAEAALTREIREELALDAAQLHYFGSHPNTYEYKGITYFVLDLAYTCTIDAEQAMGLSDEIAECRFIPLTELNPDRMAFKSTASFVRALQSVGLNDPA